MERGHSYSKPLQANGFWGLIILNTSMQCAEEPPSGTVGALQYRHTAKVVTNNVGCQEAWRTLYQQKNFLWRTELYIKGLRKRPQIFTIMYSLSIAYLTDLHTLTNNYNIEGGQRSSSPSFKLRNPLLQISPQNSRQQQQNSHQIYVHEVMILLSRPLLCQNTQQRPEMSKNNESASLTMHHS